MAKNRQIQSRSQTRETLTNPRISNQSPFSRTKREEKKKLPSIKHRSGNNLRRPILKLKNLGGRNNNKVNPSVSKKLIIDQYLRTIEFRARITIVRNLSANPLPPEEEMSPTIRVPRVSCVELEPTCIRNSFDPALRRVQLHVNFNDWVERDYASHVWR